MQIISQQYQHQLRKQTVPPYSAFDMHSTITSDQSRKKKFSDEQIKILENLFITDSKPQLRIKQRLANELGLQPRQVAIWFQNRRARLRTKQIERDHRILKASYDTLSSSFQSLQGENQRLQIQLQRLKSLLSYHPGNNKGEKIVPELKHEPSCQLEGLNGKLEVPPSSDDSIDVDYIVEADNLSITQNTEGSGRSEVNWCSFESGCSFDESTWNSQWWELWSSSAPLSPQTK